MKKLLRYINNERNDIRIKGIKSCDFTSYDLCSTGQDFGSCTGNSQDICEVDFYGCTDGGYDYCYEGDMTTCHSGKVDYD